MPTTSRRLATLLALLEPLGPVRARGMFGGHGVYCEDLFFAIVVDGQLYLKADDVLRERFGRLGMEPFSYVTGGGKLETMSYYGVRRVQERDVGGVLDLARASVGAAERARRARGAVKRRAPGG